MQREPEPARFLHAKDLVTFRHELAHVGDEFFARELRRCFQAGVILLAHRHDELQMHVQAQLERGLRGLPHRRGQGLAGRQVAGRGRKGRPFRRWRRDLVDQGSAPRDPAGPAAGGSPGG